MSVAEATRNAVTTIGLAGVNAYLVRARDGFVLVDTGKPEKRADFEAQLERAGCAPGTLKLIVLTHGDYDHADWSLGMKPRPDKFPLLFRAVSVVVRPGPFDTFSPDVLVEDGRGLRDYGLDAAVLHLPGHTKGSVGILTAARELFCGDLMDSMMVRPSLEFFIDDMAAAEASLARLRCLDVRRVYPGHGKPFRLEQVK